MVSRSQDHQGETYAERHRAEELQTVGGGGDVYGKWQTRLLEFLK